jgi:SpoVK/Ycf46/Vps4 family AAA+-type ATPase
MPIEDEILDALRAATPLILLMTVEEGRAAQAIARAAQGDGRAVHFWDCAGGFAAPSPYRAANTISPSGALAAIAASTENAVFILADFHDHWRDPVIKRQLRAAAQNMAGTQKALAVIMPHGAVPPEFADIAVTLDWPLPNAAEIAVLLEGEITQAGSVLAAGDREKLVRAALGLTAAQAQRAFRKALLSDHAGNAAIDRVMLAKRDVIRGSEALALSAAAITADDVGGLTLLKRWISLREAAFTEAGRTYGLPAPKGLALIGIPGTGKSLTAKMIGGMWHMPMIRLDVGALFGGATGDAEAHTRAALRLAEDVAPCILWIDEMEKAFAGDTQGGGNARVMGSILTWMQEKTAPCFVVGTANNVESMPAEWLRRGRFDEVFFLDLPNQQERAEILAVHLRRRHRRAEDFDVARLAQECRGLVGAEIEQAVIDAMYTGFTAGREFTSADVLASLHAQVPLSISAREQIESQRRWLDEGRAVSASLREGGIMSARAPGAG